MSLLSVVQNAADEVGIIRPIAVASSQSADPRKLLRLANKVGRQVAQAASWDVLTRKASFISDGSELQEGVLPDDFAWIIPESMYDGDKLMVGPVSPHRWANISHHEQTNPRFAFISSSEPVMSRSTRAIAIRPAPSPGTEITFLYVSRYWVYNTSGNGPYSDEYTSDAEVAALNEELITYGLIYEYLRSDGLPFQAALVAYNGFLRSEIRKEQPQAPVMSSGDIFSAAEGRHYTGIPDPDYTVIP